MAGVVVERLGKRYNDAWVIRGLDVTVDDGEFVSLLGPSGCGKTTTLRIIAGFVRPTEGRVIVEGRVLSTPEWQVPPERRGMAMVFQSYAVWPHMTVFQNVAYPLRCRRVTRRELELRTRRALELVRLQQVADRYPGELSGGQQQRVALARALVGEPAVLLLDEPLSNLDARLREELRDEIAELQRRLGFTVLYVTHDQVEAMAMSDRVAVMREGQIEQIGSPQEVYEKPRTPFVAGFVGRASFLEGEAVAWQEGRVQVVLGDGQRVEVPWAEPLRGPVWLCVRPEWVVSDVAGELRGRVVRRVYRGDRVDCVGDVPGGRLLWTVGVGQAPALGEEVSFRIVRCAVYPRTALSTSEGREAI
ncbi:MAG: polyamine ABC transporter ATP-binding protein [candidate division GAL15 bacterium]